MSKQGKNCVNYSFGKNSHIIIKDKVKLKKIKSISIVDSNGKTWDKAIAGLDQNGKRLCLRVWRTGADTRKKKGKPYDLGDDLELTVTLTYDDPTVPAEDIPVFTDYIDDPTAPC